MAPPVTARWPQVSPQADVRSRMAIVRVSLVAVMIVSEKKLRC